MASDLFELNIYFMYEGFFEVKYKYDRYKYYWY